MGSGASSHLSITSLVADFRKCLVKVGDLVQVTDDASIIALRGSVGIITRNLGKDLTALIGGSSFYYEVDLSSNGTQIIKDKELVLLSEGRKKKE